MEFTDKLNLQPVTRPVPQPNAGEILIQVYTTGVTPREHEFSGIVAGSGAGVDGYRLGDVIVCLNDWFAEGAIADFPITKPSNRSLKPSSLSHIEAASTPIDRKSVV